ncbi:flagellar hook-length control protein FliK [Ornithinibacillus massiliensis]|uniref:Flagellar hook-length control protein FliK n=1 Tax=Ornithinibacillus massiliensis TaxID=1944633 RepID=A0ABS5MD61_9BACI|nr:flagellar hook-length control protein FliK [Ornithinibacillus massiliensis]
MNAINMVSQTLRNVLETSTPNDKQANTSSLFAKLLQQGNMMKNGSSLETKSSGKEIITLEALLELNIEDNELSEITTTQDLTISTGTVMEPLDLEQLRLRLIGHHPNILIPMEVESVNRDEQVSDEIARLDERVLAVVQQKLVEVFTKFESLVRDVSTEEEFKRIAPKLLDLLKQWTSLEKDLSNHEKQAKSLELTGTKENQLWKELVVAYQNRATLSNKLQYQNDAQVTTKDVVRWLENALHNQQGTENVMPSQNTSFSSHTYVPKLEQYVIFVNQNMSGQVVEQQLMEQFHQVLKTSKFLSMPNGMNQLSISLRPENLGEMMVRLTEINGEMTVKIVVSTQAAKDMLESNISQLKHMFSPQQVVIERQDVGAGQGQAQTKQGDEQSLQGQNQDQSDDMDHQQESNHSGDDFEARLDELIRNMEV